VARECRKRRKLGHIKLIEPTMSVFFTGGTAGILGRIVGILKVWADPDVGTDVGGLYNRARADLSPESKSLTTLRFSLLGTRLAGVVVKTGSRMGRFAIINTGATVDHDNVIEDGVHISPRCHLAGNVVSRADVFIGTGTSIIARTQIGARAVIGAGATVISDVPSDVLAVGCPAVVKKHLGAS